MDDEDNITIFKILSNVGFYSTKHLTGLKSARMKDALYDLPKAIDRIRNPSLPANENVEVSSDLHGEGIERIIIPFNIIDIYSRSEILIAIKLSGHTDTLPEASTPFDEIYKRAANQNEQQYRNAPYKLSTQ